MRKRSEEEYQKYVKQQEETLRQIINVLEQNNGECDVFTIMQKVSAPLDTPIALGVKRRVLEVKFDGKILESSDLSIVEDVEEIPPDKAEIIAQRASWAFLKPYRNLKDENRFRITIPKESKVKLLVNLRVQKTLFDFF